MNLFNVTINDTGEELCVAARTMDHAAEVLVTFWLARTSSAPGAFEVGKGAPSGYEDDYVVLVAAGRNVAGILVRQPDGSMLFDPTMG